MRLFGRLFGKDEGAGVDELARRLAMPEAELRAVRPAYRSFSIPKPSGGQRAILAPEPGLKEVQRRILRRLLPRLKVHPCATGFEKGHSIVSNAAFHAGKAVVLSLDIRDFFTSTGAKRVQEYFNAIGWNKEASRLLTDLTTHKGSLPQGAPTSPRLSNLLNGLLDARMAGLAGAHGAVYTRYADDLTFSFAADIPAETHAVLWATKHILAKFGYHRHMHKKVRLRRRHQCQKVTGLVVNERASLPRKTRRWLRAVEHHVTTGRPATLMPAQLAGWRAFRQMVETQREL